MRSRVLPLLVLLGVLAAAFLYVRSTSPPWYERLRYPLRYESIVRAHARNYDLDPALLAAVIYAESKFDANDVPATASCKRRTSTM